MFKVTGLPTPVTVCPTSEVNAGQAGRIMSPSFPKHYGDNLNCKLTLKIPPFNNTEITYDIFSIESKFSLFIANTHVDAASTESQYVDPYAAKRFLKCACGEESVGEGGNWT